MKLRRPTLVHAWLLAALLLLAQGLGLAHRVLHAPGVTAAWSQDHEAGGNECRLLDQLASADILCGSQVAASALPPPADAAPQWLRSAPAAPALAPYLARAPPRG